MVATPKPADRLLELLIPIMAREGYTYRKRRRSFEKDFPCGKYEYVLLFDGRGGTVAVDAAFFVHFTSLEKRFKEVLGYECLWSAGATLLNAGADPWKFWLFDAQLASLPMKERASYTSEAVHPQARIEAGARFLEEALKRFAVPFFEKLRTYRDLADFYAEYRRAGYTGYCRPFPENVVYLSLFVAASLGDDLGEIVASAKGVESPYAGHDVKANVRTILKYLKGVNPSMLLA